MVAKPAAPFGAVWWSYPLRTPKTQYIGNMATIFLFILAYGAMSSLDTRSLDSGARMGWPSDGTRRNDAHHGGAQLQAMILAEHHGQAQMLSPAATIQTLAMC